MSRKLKKQLAKSSETELAELIKDYKTLYNEVLIELIKELKRRNYNSEKVETLEEEKTKRKKVLNRVESTKIKTKYSFGWIPKITKSFKTNLPKKLIHVVISRAMTILSWGNILSDEESVEAKREGNQNKWREKIIVDIKDDTIIISSKSIEANICDFGSNNKRVSELMMAFKLLEEEYDSNKIEKEIAELKENEYQPPEKISPPPKLKKENLNILIAGVLPISIILGGVLALLSSFIYLILLYDMGIAWITGLYFGYLIKLSNISSYNKLRWFGYTSILLTYFLNQLFKYCYIIYTYNYSGLSFIKKLQTFPFTDYVTARLENGITFEDLELGTIGLILAWVIEIAIALWIYPFIISGKIVEYDYSLIPEDVIDFTMYHFNNDKDEDEVRIELSKMGWHEKKHQEMVFKAIGSIAYWQEMAR